MDTGAQIANAMPLPKGYTVQNGCLYLNDLDLTALSNHWMAQSGLTDAPLTIRSMSRVREKIQAARDAFAAASQQTGYKGDIRLAYASKANANEAMIRTTLSAGTDYECSSRVDAWIIRHALDQGWLTPQQLVIANGFKVPDYARELIALARDGFPNVIPVFDAACEVPLFANSGVQLQVGLRYREQGRGDHFGMDNEELFEAAKLIANAPTLTLKVFHAIQHYPALENPEHLASLKRAFGIYRQLKATYPTLAWFDIGGGLPVQPMEADDLQEWMVSVQRMIMAECGNQDVPGLIIESGRYLAGCHQLYVFRVVRVKTVDGVPYYVLSGGLMSNLPDSWALGVEFPVTALNHMELPQQLVKLAGLTCDHDDVYPTKSERLVSLPVQTDDLLVAFLDTGAYQDMLGGEGGAKHCLLSEGGTIIIGDDPAQPSQITYCPPQSTGAVLSHLGFVDMQSNVRS